MAGGGKISALGWSLAVHAVIAAGFIVTVRYAVPVQPAQPSGEVIEAVAIDAEAMREREREKAEVARRAEEARQAELRRQREAAERAAAEQQRREEEARQAELRKQEAARRQKEAEEKRAAEEARRKAEAERQRKAEAERQRKAEAEAKRKAEAERKQREAEAAARAQREQELQRSLEAEEQRLAAIRSGKQAQWIGAIRNKVERVLVTPPGTSENFYCEAELRQIPGGEVVQVTIGRCDSDLLARAIETAVWKASPLPRPEDPSLFEPYVTVVFAPEEK